MAYDPVDRQLEYFLAVARHRSFSRAAVALHVSQPALSQQIKRLEEDLGARLFDRGSRDVHLTDAGFVYSRYARQAITSLQHGRQMLKNENELTKGNLRIAATPTLASYIAGPAASALHARFPHATMKIKELDEQQLERQLLDDEIDIGVTFDKIQWQGIQVHPLYSETLCFVVGSQHRLYGAREIPLTVLGNEKLVLLSRKFATRREIDHCCHQQGVYPQMSIETESVTAIINIVRNSALSTLLPARLVSNQTELAIMTIKPVLLRRQVVITRRRDAYTGRLASAFMAELETIAAQSAPQNASTSKPRC